MAKKGHKASRAVKKTVVRSANQKMKGHKKTKHNQGVAFKKAWREQGF